MKIYNGTTHQINIYDTEDTIAVQGGRKLVLKDGAKPLHTIPGGHNLNCTKVNATPPEINAPFPIEGAVRFVGYDPVPEGYDLIVVSNLYRAAVEALGGDTSNLATVSGTVYEDETAIRPCGCTALAVG